MNRLHKFALVVLLLVSNPLIAADVRFNSFLTAGVGILSNDKFTALNYSDEPSFEPDAIFGIQATVDINEDLQLTGQLVSRGNTNFETRNEWAYLSHEITPEWTVRAGRLRIPLFMFSETLEIGYTYPWIRPPMEMYTEFLNSVNGVNALYRKKLGNWHSSFEVYFGSLNETVTNYGSETEVELKSLSGMAFTLEKDWISFRLGYHQGELSIDMAELEALRSALTAAGYPQVANELLIEHEKGQFVDLGMQLNFDDYLFIAEITNVDIDANVFPENISWYTTFGYYLKSDVLLHLTYAYTDSDDAYDLSAPIPSGVNASLDALKATVDSIAAQTDSKQDSVTLGLRYDYLPGIAYKAEWQRIYVEAGHGAVVSKSSNINADGYSDLFSIAVDVAF